MNMIQTLNWKRTLIKIKKMETKLNRQTRSNKGAVHRAANMTMDRRKNIPPIALNLIGKMMRQITMSK